MEIVKLMDCSLCSKDLTRRGWAGLDVIRMSRIECVYCNGSEVRFSAKETRTSAHLLGSFMTLSK